MEQSTGSEARAAIEALRGGFAGSTSVSAWVTVFTDAAPSDPSAGAARLETFQREMGPSLEQALRAIKSAH